MITEQLEFLDKEIEQARGGIKEITVEYKTAMVDAKNHSERKEEFEFLKVSFQSRITDATRRLSVLEDVRMSLILEEVVKEKCEVPAAGSKKKSQKSEPTEG